MMFTTQEQAVIDQAIEIVTRKLASGPALTSPDAVKALCQVRMAHLQHEVFAMLLLNNQHELIKVEELFRGTIDGAAVYPREVVKSVLAANAAAVIFAHNHPSGLAEPSQADIHITRRLATALEVIEVRVLDHMVVGRTVTSFAERGLL